MVNPLLIGAAVLLLLGIGLYVAFGRDEDLDEQVTESTAAIADPNYLGGLQAAGALLVIGPLFLLSSLLRVAPASWRIFHKIHLWSARQMQKAASADVLANVRYDSGHEDTLPAKMVEGSEDDPEQSGWKVKGLGDKRYGTGVQDGRSTRFGKADMIHLNEDDTHQGTWTEAVLDNAFQLDRERYLFTDAKLAAEQAIFDVTPNELQTDGGQPEMTERKRVTQNVTLEQPGVLQDILAPANSPEGYDGQQVSLAQFRTAQTQTADQDTIREAKNSGWMAAKFDNMSNKDLIKWALILGAGYVVALFDDEIAALIAGGGGGAVSGAADSAGLGMVNHLHLLAGVGVF